MNQVVIKTKEAETQRKYDHNSSIHVNCIRFSKGENFEHALVKFLTGWITSQGGDVSIILPKIIPIIPTFVEKVDIETKGWFFKGSERHFLTEAIVKDRTEKHDFVTLESGEIIEIVKNSDPPRTKGENVTRYWI